MSWFGGNHLIWWIYNPFVILAAVRGDCPESPVHKVSFCIAVVITVIGEAATARCEGGIVRVTNTVFIVTRTFGWNFDGPHLIGVNIVIFWIVACG